MEQDNLQLVDLIPAQGFFPVQSVDEVASKWLTSGKEMGLMASCLGQPCPPHARCCDRRVDLHHGVSSAFWRIWRIAQTELCVRVSSYTKDHAPVNSSYFTSLWNLWLFCHQLFCSGPSPSATVPFAAAAAPYRCRLCQHYLSSWRPISAEQLFF